MSVHSLREQLAKNLGARTPRSPKLGESAAVLMGLSAFDGGPRLWFIRRPEHMRKHGGQVAFPGGKYEAEDDSLLETALREAEEEIGLPRQLVSVLGPLEEVVIGFSGMVVTPYVAWVGEGFEPRPDEREVARVFTVSLQGAISALEGVHPLVGVTIEGERLWGASAWMVKRLAAELR